MLNTSDIPSSDVMNVIDYADPVVAERMANGKVNTTDEQILANIKASIRRGHPQMRTGPVRPERICLVGSGPSLNDTGDELRTLLWEGAILVTLNGAYHWCLERNLRPNTQIIMDARPSNARFLQPAVPHCRYVLASQCAPAVWDAVAGRDNVWIFHAAVRQESAICEVLDTYYCGQWIGIGGGTTVASRALNLLRTVGYVRFDLFGIDCCWHGDQHHAFEQPENASDKRARVFVGVKDQPGQTPFLVSPWMLKQYEDFLTTLKINGKHFQIHVHGRGMLAHTVQRLGGGDLDSLTIEKE